MKTYVKYIIPALILLTILAVSHSNRYKDGSYEGRSRSIYTQEPFMGKVSVEISDGLFTNIDFSIYDTTNNEPFDEKYEKHYAGNQLYIEQCRNDWRGVQIYPKLLLEKQDLNEVDAISGATWSYNLFKASMTDALKKAK